ncbi:MAG TPA: diphthine synthase [Candidatus Nanoarchaeia archaeon]|nr:diphthine synthase [Candidatus Nanoarchaeia archaeon]
MLYIIGIGLGNEKDITIDALEVLKKCESIYLECYTSNIGFDIKKLEELTGRKIILADRNLVENNAGIIIENAKNNETAFLVKGDVFSATTHISLLTTAMENKVKWKILHNASILTAVSDTGLMLYKFGKTTSIPFNNVNTESPYKVLKDNLLIGAHTLFLLDIKSSEEFMNYKEGIKYLLNIEQKKKLEIFNENTKIVVCAGLGSENAAIKYGSAAELKKISIEVYPQCIIIPAKLHFTEEEMLNTFSSHQQQ